MSRSISVRVLLGAIGASALIAWAAVALVGSTAAQDPEDAPTEPPPPSEARARALEDAEILERLVEAKANALREAEARLALERAQKADYARTRKFGINSEIGELQVDLRVLERESERALRDAELTEAQTRLAQARRRIALIDRRGLAGAGLIETIGRDLDRMTGRLDRIEVRLDRFGASLEATRKEISRLEQAIRADRE